MQITPIPFQTMARHLKMGAGKEIAFTLRLDTLGVLQYLPNLVIDRMITFLDGQSALQLKITCVAFCVLVKANPRQETWYTLRFFDLASVQIAENQEGQYIKDRILQYLTVEIVRRGDESRALKIVENLNEKLQDVIYGCLALKRAMPGDIDSTFVSLNQMRDRVSHSVFGPLITKKLAKSGDYVNALTIVNHLLPIDLAEAQNAYKNIIRAQLIPGDQIAADDIIATLDHHIPDDFIPTLLYGLACVQAEQGDKEGAQRTLERLDNPVANNDIQEILKEIAYLKKTMKLPVSTKPSCHKQYAYEIHALQHIKRGDLQTARIFLLTLQDKFKRDHVYSKLAKAHIRRDELQPAITIVDDIMCAERSQFRVYAHLAVAHANKGDFLRALQRLEQIRNNDLRANAYQQVVTALLCMI